MQAIADWLEKLGMSEYAERFAENRIDLSVLPDLTDQDLEKLGVVLGDRRKMLRSIRELSGAVLASLQPAFTEPKLQDTAERRQVTVMFSDLVGSTALAGRMDGRRNDRRWANAWSPEQIARRLRSMTPCASAMKPSIKRCSFKDEARCGAS